MTPRVVRLAFLWPLVLRGGGDPAPPARTSPAPDPPEPAIALIQRRAANAFPGTPEARLIAGQLEELGREKLARGQLGPALELLGDAYSLDEGNGLVLAELTLAYLRAGEFEEAGFYLRLAEDRVPRAPPEIYAVLGDVYDALHRLDDAVAAWTESMRLGGQDPALLRRVARARDEVALSRGQRVLESASFVVFAEPDVPADFQQDAAERLEAAHRLLADFFGSRLPDRQVVVLYRGRRYFALASAPDWASGVYDGKIRISVEPDGGGDALSQVATHEIAHAVIRRASAGRAPSWLHEGLAQWLEGRRIPRREIRALLGGHAASSLEALEESFGGSLDRAKARVRYAEALSLVEYIAASRGEGALACLVARMGLGAHVDEAIALETGLSASALYDAWRRWAGV